MDQPKEFKLLESQKPGLAAYTQNLQRAHQQLEVFLGQCALDLGIPPGAKFKFDAAACALVVEEAEEPQN
jgi:hypothetical protein